MEPPVLSSFHFAERETEVQRQGWLTRDPAGWESAGSAGAWGAGAGGGFALGPHALGAVPCSPPCRSSGLPGVASCDQHPTLRIRSVPASEAAPREESGPWAGRAGRTGWGQGRGHSTAVPGTPCPWSHVRGPSVATRRGSEPGRGRSNSGRSLGQASGEGAAGLPWPPRKTPCQLIWQLSVRGKWSLRGVIYPCQK